jgi:hypothetical protein
MSLLSLQYFCQLQAGNQGYRRHEKPPECLPLKKANRYGGDAYFFQPVRNAFQHTASASKIAILSGYGKSGYPKRGQSAVQGRQHGIRRFLYNAQIRAGGGVGLALSLFPITQRIDGKAELCRKHGLSQAHVIPDGLYVNVFRRATDCVRLVCGLVGRSIHIGNSFM